MLKPNMHYSDLEESYLFRNIAQKVSDYQSAHPDAEILRLGIGDVTLPLAEAVIEKLHEAVDDQANKGTFHGYMDECGDASLRHTIAQYYSKRGVTLSDDEVFISSGASDELGDVINLFDRACGAMIIEPAYPAYVDANVMEGRKVTLLPADISCGFTPDPPNYADSNDDVSDTDIIYICSPNNPTGAVFTREKLKKWVDFANKTGAVILFDAAYEAFIEDETLPHSIFEIEGAHLCAIEICSLSKTAGFTGTRLGYTIMSNELERRGMNLHEMWVRNRTTKTNGVSYILQKGAMAAFSQEGQAQIRANLDIYKKNAATIAKALDELGIWYCGGKNSPYVWFECPNNMSSWETFDYLLDEIQVVGTPGSGFGDCGEGFFRLSAFGSPEVTAKAAKRIVNLFSK